MDEKVRDIIDGLNLAGRPMRDPARIEPILEHLKDEWLKSPDLRFGQLFVNLLRSRSNVDSMDEVFFIEDEELFPEIFEKAEEDRTI